eukprot:COSAG01_NODE_1359_length_10584_cov_133.767668_4_plen_91_part_00
MTFLTSEELRSKSEDDHSGLIQQSTASVSCSLMYGIAARGAVRYPAVADESVMLHAPGCLLPLRCTRRPAAAGVRTQTSIKMRSMRQGPA